MATIDDLSIKINASATAAMPALDEMIKKLTELNNQLTKSGSSIPTYTRSFSSMNTTVRTTHVSFGRLNSVLKSAGNSMKNTVKHVGNLAKGFGNAQSLSKTFANAIGGLYVKFQLLKRGASGLWSSIESSMGMVETVHYFETAMEKIQVSASEAGKDTATAFGESYRDQMMTLTQKMTGFGFDAEGNATAYGGPNLGMNPDLIMQYQAQYAQMADSIGMTGQAATNTAKAMTMLAADWSSLRNVSFESSYQKMASALAGQSRAVRSLGIDITQAALQETAYKYGLDQTVSTMNQATKAELRMLTILDQSRVAWADMAKTLNTPANQFRLLSQNVQSLARTLGNLFLPIVAKVLPYINGLVIALQRLFAWLGGLLGIEVGELSASTGGMSEDFADFGDTATAAADDTADSLEGATKSAEKLKRTILGFDELNVLNGADTSSASGSGTGGTGGGTGISAPSAGLLDDALAGALEEYEKVWNAALNSMESKAQKFADKITSIGQKMYSFIQDKDWHGLGNYMADGINQGVKKIYDVLKSDSLGGKINTAIDAITGTINGLLDGVDFNLMGISLAAGINLLATKITRAINGINWSKFGKDFADYIRGIVAEIDPIVLANLVSSKFNAFWNMVSSIVANLPYEETGKKFANFLNTAFKGMNLDLAARSLATALNGLFNGIKSFIETFDWEGLKNKLVRAINNFINHVEWRDIGATLGELINSVWHTLFTTIAEIDWPLLAKNLGEGLVSLMEELDTEKAGNDFSTAVESMISGIDAFNKTGFWYTLGTKLGTLLSTVNWITIANQLLVVIFDALKGFWLGFGSTTAGKIVEAITAVAVVTKIAGGIGKLLGLGISTFSTGKDIVLTAAGFASALKGVVEKGIALVIPKLSTLFAPIATEISTIMSGALGAVMGAAIAASIGATYILSKFADRNGILTEAGGALNAFTQQLKDSQVVSTDTIKKLEDAVDGYEEGLYTEGEALDKYIEILETSGLSAEQAVALINGMDFTAGTQTVNALKEQVKGLGEGFSTSASIIDAGKTPVNEAIDYINQAFNNLQQSELNTDNTLSGLYATWMGMDHPVSSANEALDSAITFMSNYTEGNEHAQEIQELFVNYLLTQYPEAFKTAENAVTTSSGNMLANIQSSMLGIQNNAQEKLSQFHNTVRSFFGLSADTTKEKTEEMSSKVESENEEISSDTAAQWGAAYAALLSNQDTMVYDTNAKMETIYKYVRAWMSSIVEQNRKYWESMSATARTELSATARDVEEKFTGINSTLNTKFNTLNVMVSGLTSAVTREVDTLLTNLTNDFIAIYDNADSFFDETYRAQGSFLTAMITDMVSFRDDVKTVFSDIVKTIKGTFDNQGLYNVGYNAMASIQNGINDVGLKLPHIYWDWDRITYGNGGWFEIPSFGVSWYQNGGTPNVGELFWMNENGDPELMYKKGGKTNIDSNTEIVNSLKSAIIEGMMNVVMATGMNGGTQSEPVLEFTLKSDSETLFKQVLKGKKKMQGRGYKVESVW